jgi:site-specific recombinase XerC
MMGASGLIRDLVEQHKRTMREMLAQYEASLDECRQIYEETMREYSRQLGELLDGEARQGD